MIQALYAEDLTLLLSCGCGVPGCTHKAEWLRARCHLKSGLMAVYDSGNLLLSCHKCNKPVVNLVVTGKKEFFCHPNSGLKVRYDNGILYCYCHTCNQYINSIEVAKKDLGE